jgi:hypothetical protein
MKEILDGFENFKLLLTHHSMTAEGYSPHESGENQKTLNMTSEKIARLSLSLLESQGEMVCTVKVTNRIS